jgi:hypothetical protein
MKNYQWLVILCGGLVASARADIVIENFEKYATTDDLLASWTPSGNTTLSVSDVVSPKSTGKVSMKMEFSFPSVQWATETVKGPTSDTPISIRPDQYVTFRYRSDPAFAKSDFHNLYLYVYDQDGNFSRWTGIAMPANSDWQIANFKASNTELTWDTTGTYPDLSNIVRFAFFQYGSQGAIDPYTATVYVDDLVVRDTPLNEFPAPSAPRQLIDDFESYANDAALTNAYTVVNNPPATTTTPTLTSPAPQGSKALKLAIDFGAGQWPWGAVMSKAVAPFSLPTNAVISLRFKGDPGLSAIADDGTGFWLSFYDRAGGYVNFITAGKPIVTGEWTTLQATFADLGDTTTVDVGNLIQWRILLQGWTGTTDSQPLTGTAIYVDDIRITVPTVSQPSLSIAKDGKTLSLKMDGLTAGKIYQVGTSSNLTSWTSATEINATGPTADWTVTPTESAAFYQLTEKP